MISFDDTHYMRAALALARRGLGRVAPNPAVGCILVKNGIVVGRGWTGDGGRPHAESVALQQAGFEARGATAYVTLEPCAHQGKTPPCAQGLIDAGVARVVIACRDPDPRVNGQGDSMLRAAGIEVACGVLEDDARALNAGFFLRITEDRPFVTLKIATSADGKIAGGPQRWITGEAARAHAHLIRAQHDAILVGSGTFKADQPQLTTRIPGYEHESMRVVLGDVEAEGFLALPHQPVRDVLSDLAQRGVTRLLVEGGAKILQAFADAGYGDAFLCYRAPQAIGAGGLAIDVPALTAQLGLTKTEEHALGEDMLEVYTRPPASS